MEQNPAKNIPWIFQSHWNTIRILYPVDSWLWSLRKLEVNPAIFCLTPSDTWSRSSITSGLGSILLQIFTGMLNDYMGIIWCSCWFFGGIPMILKSDFWLSDHERYGSECMSWWQKMTFFRPLGFGEAKHNVETIQKIRRHATKLHVLIVKG